MTLIRLLTGALALSVGACAVQKHPSDGETPTTVLHVTDQDIEKSQRMWMGGDEKIAATSRFEIASHYKTVYPFTLLVRAVGAKVRPRCDRFRLAEVINPGAEVEVWRISFCDETDALFTVSGPSENASISIDDAWDD
jgi:hypothetical protein